MKQSSVYNADDDEEELIFDDVENYRGEKDEGFSHQRDVSRAISRVLETGSVEMKPGYTDFKKDKSSGELIMSKYHPDTREMFIESVNNLYDICIAEINKSKTHKKEIDKILAKKKKSYEKWALAENKFWKGLDFKSRREIPHVPGSIAKDSNFYSRFMTDLINISRELAREINLLLDTGKYWKAVVATN